MIPLLLAPAKVVYRNTITGLLVSAVDGTAFIDNANASVTALADGNHSIEIYDSSNRMVKGVLKAAGSSETVATTGGALDDGNLVTDGTFDGAGWTGQAGWAVAGGVATATASQNSVYRSINTVNEVLYKSTFDIVSRTAGSASTRFFSINGTAQSSAGTYSCYRTSIATSTNAAITGIDTFTGVVDNLILKQVLTPSSSGCTIVSSKAGETYNFAYKNASFTYNAASYYCIIRAIR